MSGNSAKRGGDGEAPHSGAKPVALSDMIAWVSQADLSEVETLDMLVQMRLAALGSDRVKDLTVSEAGKSSRPKLWSEQMEDVPPGSFQNPLPRGGSSNRGSGSGSQVKKPVGRLGNQRPQQQQRKISSIPLGESGSGFSKTKKGKLVKNKPPKKRLVQEGQAKNWRSRAQGELRDFLISKEVKPSDLKKSVESKSSTTFDISNEQYNVLLARLNWAKTYYRLVRGMVRGKLSPIPEVQAFRESWPMPTFTNGELQDEAQALSQVEEPHRALIRNWIPIVEASTSSPTSSSDEEEGDH